MDTCKYNFILDVHAGGINEIIHNASQYFYFISNLKQCLISTTEFLPFLWRFKVPPSV